MPQEPRIVGIDVSKSKVDACIRALRQQLSQPSTPQGEAALISWLHENGVGQAVMEASCGYERLGFRDIPGSAATNRWRHVDRHGTEALILILSIGPQKRLVIDDLEPLRRGNGELSHELR